MIVKSSDIQKIDIKKNNLILFYGKNEGLKDQSIAHILKNKKIEISSFEEKEILLDMEIFIENILSRSLFEDEKIIIIKRATEKIFKFIEIIVSKNLQDIFIIIQCDMLEKKSKLRSYFEKDKKYICVAFYPDNEQTLSKIAYTFFKNENIAISQANINSIINKCNGDRGRLLNELNKIKLFSLNGKKLNTKSLAQLVSLTEDHNVSELIDNCLVKNHKKTLDILNENNFTNEDCILITRVFLNKLKRILKLSIEFEKNNNINLTISSAKPPIFWKDKEITKQLIYKWKPKKIKNLIYKLNKIELNIKKNINNSVNLLTDFILEQTYIN